MEKADEEVLDRIRNGDDIIAPIPTSWDSFDVVVESVKEYMELAVPPFNICDRLKIIATLEIKPGDGTKIEIFHPDNTDELLATSTEDTGGKITRSCDLKGLIFPVHQSVKSNTPNHFVLVTEGVSFDVNMSYFSNIEGDNWNQIIEAFAVRNEKIGIDVDIRNPSTTIQDIFNAYQAKIRVNRGANQTKPKTANENYNRAETYSVGTSQPVTALASAVCDAPTSSNWNYDVQRKLMVHTQLISSYRAETSLPSTFETGEAQSEALSQMIQKVDADCMFMFFYLMELFVEAEERSERSVWIDFEDIARKIGYTRRELSEKRQAREKVMDYITFLSNTRVTGQGRHVYRDKSGQEIDTKIDHPLFLVDGRELPVQGELFGEFPVRVELILSSGWRGLLSAPGIKNQILPMGEKIASIPRGKPAGAWAAVIGYALLWQWRLGKRSFSRRTLLQFQPKGCTPTEILESTHPKRAIEYWEQALGLLRDYEIIEDTSEGIDPQELPRKNWQEAWLNQEVCLKPCKEMEAVLKGIDKNRFRLKPKDLSKPPPQKRRS